MDTPFDFSIEPEGLGVLVFDAKDKKVNILSRPILQEFEQIIDQLATHQGIKVLLIKSGKEHQFVAGADLKDFEQAFDRPEVAEEAIGLGHRVFNKLAKLPFPTIAAIDGVCVGGGLELALACTYRIVADHPKTLLGLPETQIGIMPGWGGTQRLPRLIGLTSALDLILSGKTINATKAYKLKLADAIYPWEFFNEKSLAFAANILKPQEVKKIKDRRKLKGFNNFILQKNPLGRSLVYYQSKKQILEKTRGFYPAPLVALETVKETYTKPLAEGLEIEKKTFLSSIPGAFSNAKNLIKVFFQNEALKKDAGYTDKTPAKPVKSAGVLGAGTMGSGLIFLFSYYDIPVRFKEITWEVIGKGYGLVNTLYSKMIELKKLTKDQATMKFQKVSGTVDYSGFNHADIVIEAATENLELKHSLFKELEKVIRKDAIIASNTSSLTIAQMSTVMEQPERFVGMHFFNPPNRMPLVEVVKGEKTSAEAVATAVDVCRKLGRTPIVVKDCPGFLVNRIFAVSANEMLRFLEEGVPLNTLEKTFIDFGMPMAPCHLADEVGNDVTFKVSHIFENAYGDRMKAPALLEGMNKQGLYGKKVGKGFYLYEGKKVVPNPEIQKLLSGLKKENKTPPPPEEMVDRALFLMVNEAARCLSEHIVEEPSSIDMALILGIGFPPFRGGLLRYADSRGIQTIVDKLREFEQKQGSRYTPCDYLIEMAESKKTFYP